MIERLNYASIGLKNLLCDIFSTPQVEYSCGIILRSVLLDYMIVLNALIKIANSSTDKAIHEELNLFCTEILSESVNHTLKDISKLKLSNEDLKLFYKNFAKMYSDCLEPYNNDGTFPVSKIRNTFSPGKLFEKIYSDKDFRQYSNVYQAYLFYSKYDHFGRMYYDFRRHSLSDRIYRLNESSKVFPKIIQFISTILFILYNDDEVVKRQFKEMQEYIRNN